MSKRPVMIGSLAEEDAKDLFQWKRINSIVVCGVVAGVQ